MAPLLGRARARSREIKIGLAAATMVIALLYAPLGTCGRSFSQRCYYRGHGWVFVYYTHTDPDPDPDEPRRQLVIDRWFAQLGAAAATASVLLWSARMSSERGSGQG